MNHTDVLTAIEAAQWDFEPELQMPGVYEIRTDALCLRKSDTSTSPLANKVVRSVFTEDIDKQIDDVFGLFEPQGQAFSWWIGPNTQPRNLRERLVQRGMRLADEYVGLVFDLAEMTPQHHEPRWTVEEAVTDTQLHGHASVSAAVWGLDPTSTQVAVQERRRYVDFQHRRGGFLVVRDGQQYIGNASYRASTDGQTMYLVGGAVLPEYRGQGVYRAMLVHRLVMAAQRGCRLATTQARVGTSEPILKRMGFVEHGRFSMMVKD